jgi:hypothetical protein
MSTNITISVVVVTMAGTLFVGCGKPLGPKIENAREKVGNAQLGVTDVRAEYLAEWETFKREAAKSLEADETELHSLRHKMAHDGSKLNAQYEKEVTALEQRNRDLKKRLDEYKADGQTQWEEFKMHVQHDMAEVETTMIEVSRKIQ